MLYHTAFYEVIHRPYTLESSIIDIFVLSFYHLSIYPHPFISFFFKIHNRICEKLQLLQLYDWSSHIVTVSLDLDNTKQ